MASRRNSSKWFVRIDVDHATNPKMLGVDPLARLLYIDALCYSAQWQTDGLIPARWIGSQPDGTDYAEDLAERGLLDRDGDDYRVHDYAEHQITSDDRTALSRAGRAAASARWTPKENPIDKGLDADRMRVACGTHSEGEGEEEKEKTLKRVSVLPSKTSPSAKEVLEEWNRIFGKRFTVKGWGARVDRCIRSHPELTLADHVAMIERESALPWWNGQPSPALQYGTVGQFEKCINSDGIAPRQDTVEVRLEAIRAERAARDSSLIEEATDGDHRRD